ncbi:MAG: sigma-54-dependent Fis family transcriptional regulator [candidate division Zixibacteria bacterium]|nr:sigma-54-dependent Fis family transcriptional regulator [candidate division Zixibacteria bacterium]
MTKAKILVVDDEEIVLKSCRKILEGGGHQVFCALSGQEAFELLEKEPIDIVITDIKMPGMDGMQVLEKVKEKYPDILVIMITGYSTVQSAVQAMKLGAFDYIPKPFTPDEVLIVVEKALEKKSLIFENIYLRKELEAKYGFDNIIGSSPKMQEVYKLIRKVAPTDSTVLIRGESGTGKELIARAIHFNSPRKQKPFVPVDCGVLAQELLESELFGHVKGSFTGAIVTKPGLFEIADGGSIFLDEIGDVNPNFQSKLLRAIQEREFTPVGGVKPKKVDLRFIVATNKDLEKMVEEKQFREDLFYRLNVISITVPPLKERKDDIPLLAYHFLKKYAIEMKKDIKSISVDAMNMLIAYSWPGNVRQLENVIERAIVMAEADTITTEHLPFVVGAEMAHPDTPIPKTAEELKGAKKKLRETAVGSVEKSFLLDALTRNDWNITKSAKDVGMQRPNFQALMRKYNIRIEK